MTVLYSVLSRQQSRLLPPPIRHVASLALAIPAVAVAVGIGYGSADAIFAMTGAATAVGGAYWLGRSAPGREAPSAAGSDGLTGLPNRGGFFGALESSLASGTLDPLAVGLINLDNFSAINDTHGHRVGDRVLRDLAMRLEMLVPDAFVAHLGSDKFGFLVRGDPEQARILAEAVRERAAAPYEISGLLVHVGCSGGLAVLQKGTESADALFDRASCALRSAKASNRGGVALYDADLERRVRTDRAIGAALQRCDPVREMSILFQPIYDLEAGRITAVEALARWTSPQLGPVQPDVFIATAERLGLIHTITLALLRKTLGELDRLPDAIDVSFNLSARDITDSRTVTAIVALVREMGVDPRRIIFEITETAMIRNFEVAADTVRLLRSLGARVALDDFGSGYSSLGYLHRMTFDRIKIDRSFMAEVELSEGRRLLASIVGLCRNLGLGCIVEGVETPEQLTIIRDIGCRAYQGYLLSRPMTPDEFLAWLALPIAA